MCAFFFLSRDRINMLRLELASFVSCLAFSTLAHTSRLMLGGAIPDNRYNFSTLVGLRHPVLARHALLSYASSL